MARGDTEVHAWSRRGDAAPGAIAAAVDIEDEASIARAVDALGDAPLTHVLIATGLLHGQGVNPERALAELDGAALARLFAVNAIGPALLLKHLAPRLPRQARLRDRPAVRAGRQPRGQPARRLVRLPRLQGGAEHADPHRRRRTRAHPAAGAGRGPAPRHGGHAAERAVPGARTGRTAAHARARGGRSAGGARPPRTLRQRRRFSPTTARASRTDAPQRSSPR